MRRRCVCKRDTLSLDDSRRMINNQRWFLRFSPWRCCCKNRRRCADVCLFYSNHLPTLEIFRWDARARCAFYFLFFIFLLLSVRVRSMVCFSNYVLNSTQYIYCFCYKSKSQSIWIFLTVIPIQTNLSIFSFFRVFPRSFQYLIWFCFVFFFYIYFNLGCVTFVGCIYKFETQNICAANIIINFFYFNSDFFLFACAHDKDIDSVY